MEINKDKLTQDTFKGLKDYSKQYKYMPIITYCNGFKFKFVPYSMFVCLTASAMCDNGENIKPINKGLKINGEYYI